MLDKTILCSPSSNLDDTADKTESKTTKCKSNTVEPESIAVDDVDVKSDVKLDVKLDVKTIDEECGNANGMKSLDSEDVKSSDEYNISDFVQEACSSG